MDPGTLSHAVTAFLAAGFAVGGNLIIRYLVSGKVTPDHLKKEDIAELKNELQKHLERHETCEKDFVKKETFDTHIHNCPVKQVEKDLIDHEISHGRHDSEIFTRLKTIEKQIIESSSMFAKLTDGLHSVDKKLGLMVQRIDLFFDEKKWNGNERRK
jgi:hypothetical protein